MSNTKNKVFSGLFWTFGERITAQLVSFIVSIVLARLLMPEDYGAIAMITIFISIANVFVTSGFSSALIQKKDADELDFSTIFWCSLVVSLAIYAVLFVMAPVIASFYRMPILKSVLRVLAIQLPLSAYKSTQHAYVSRHMIFKKFFFSTLFGTIVSAFVGIAMAYNGFGVWALVAQQLTNFSIDSTVLSFTVAWHPKFIFSWMRAKSLMNFGWKVLAADLSGTFFDQLRSLIIGRVYTASDLAYYNRGKTLSNLVTENVSSAVMSVLFPALSNSSDDTAQMKTMTRRAVKVMAYVIFPLAFGIAAVARPLIDVLLGSKWTQVVPYLQILSIAGAFGLIGSISLQAIKAIGRSDVLLKLEFIKKPIYMLLLVIGARIDVLFVAITMAIYNIIGALINAQQLKKLINYNYLEQLYDLSFAIVASLAMFGIVFTVNSIGFPELALLIADILIGTIFYIAVSKIAKNDSYAYILSFAKEKHGNR